MRAVLLFVICLTACAPCEPEIITRTVYEEVPYPVPCEVPLPKRPARQKDAVMDTLNLLEYTETLEQILKACKGE